MKQNVKVRENDPIDRHNFKLFADLYVLKTRSVALEGMLEGLTLGNHIDINCIFFPVQPVFIDALLFSKPVLNVDDVLKILRYDFTDEEEESFSETAIENQQLFSYQTFPEALKLLSMKDPEFMTVFITFITGFPCLPDHRMNPDFKIIVEFEMSLPPDNLPTAHACHNILTVPGQCYKNDVEKFVERLETALKWGKDEFGMH